MISSKQLKNYILVYMDNPYVNNWCQNLKFLENLNKIIKMYCVNKQPSADLWACFCKNLIFIYMIL